MGENRDQESKARELASIVGLFHVGAAGETPWWREEELDAILQHQLDAPLGFDLRECPGAEMSSDAQQKPADTFRDVLTANQPSLPLLQRLKEFAKSADKSTQNPLPTPVAMVLYYWAIVAARLRCSARISSMSERELRRGIAWVTRQVWLDKPTRNFFRTALAVQS